MSFPNNIEPLLPGDPVPAQLLNAMQAATVDHHTRLAHLELTAAPQPPPPRALCLLNITSRWTAGDLPSFRPGSGRIVGTGPNGRGWLALPVSNGEHIAAIRILAVDNAADGRVRLQRRVHLSTHTLATLSGWTAAAEIKTMPLSLTIEDMASYYLEFTTSNTGSFTLLAGRIDFALP